MQIEAIDPIRAVDDDGKTDIRMEPGDVLTVGDNFGALACSQGWAQDTAGVVPTGEKSRDSVTVTPENVVVPQGAK